MLDLLARPCSPVQYPATSGFNPAAGGQHRLGAADNHPVTEPPAASPESLIDRRVVDPAGKKVGSVGQIFTDDLTGQPAWITVNTGLFGMTENFIPLMGSAIAGKALRVPFALRLYQGFTDDRGRQPSRCVGGAGALRALRVGRGWHNVTRPWVGSRQRGPLPGPDLSYPEFSAGRSASRRPAPAVARSS